MPRDIDRVLDAWFEDGPSLVADRVVGAALAQVEEVRQARPMIRGAFGSSGRQRMATWQLLAATIAIAVTLVGLGFAVGILRINPRPPLPPNESSQPTPSPVAEGFTLFSSEEDGYEILIPNGWAEVTSEHPDARQWEGPDGALMISYGASIFEGGEVSVCAPPAGDMVGCTTLDHGFSVPFDPAVDGVGPIDLEVFLDRCDGGCSLTTTTASLDGETAGEQRAVIKERQLTYVTGFHKRRPVVLYWNEPVASADKRRVETMRSSFHFLDPAIEGTPEPLVDPTELVAHVDADAGYEILVPRFWEASAAPVFRNGETIPGVTRMGSGSGAGTRGDPGLTISVGNRNGSIYLCQPLCERFVVASLDELEEALISRYERLTGPPQEASGSMKLDGEPARWERPGYEQGGDFAELGIGPMTGGGNCLGCPQMRYHAFAFHNGRPVVLAFDYWNIAFERFKTEYVAQVIESFRFLD